MKKHPKHWSRALSLLLTVFMAVQLITPAVAVQAQPTMEDGLVAESVLQNESATTQTAEEEQTAEEAQTTDEAQTAEDAQPAEEPQETEVPQNEEIPAPAEEPAEPEVLQTAETGKYEYVEVKTVDELAAGGTYVIHYEPSNSILYYVSGQDKVAQISTTLKGNKVELTNPKQFPEGNQTWTITPSDGEYTVQSCDGSGKYLNLDARSAQTGVNVQVVPVTTTAQKLTIVPMENGGFSIGGQVNGAKLYLAHTTGGYHYIAEEPCAFRIFKKTPVEQPPKPADPMEIPGYKRVETAELDATKYYLVVSQDSKGNLYAFYPDKEQMNAKAGNAIAKEYAGAFVANLTVNGDNFSAVHESNQRNIPTEDLRFVVTKRNGQYSFRGTNGLYLALTDSMLSTGRNYFTVTAPSGSFLLKSGNGRVLDFSKDGDANQFAPGYSTNFWGPSVNTTKSPIYLYEQIGTAVVPDPADAMGQDIQDMFAIEGDINTNNTWMFDGGIVTQGSFDDIAGARSYVYQFEEFIRWTNAAYRDRWVTRQRYTFNVAKEGQTLADSLAAFDSRKQALDTRGAVYMVGPEDCAAGAAGIETFKTNLTNYINKALALRNDTGFAVVMTPYATLPNADLYTQAVKDVLKTVDQAKLGRVQIVDLSTGTYPVNANGTLTAKGHLEVAEPSARQCLAVPPIILPTRSPATSLSSSESMCLRPI